MAEQQPGQVEQSSVRAPIFTFRDQVKDFARPNLFQVEIYAPPILQDGVSPLCRWRLWIPGGCKRNRLWRF